MGTSCPQIIYRLLLKRDLDNGDKKSVCKGGMDLKTYFKIISKPLWIHFFSRVAVSKKVYF